ncbi:hypothetical protein V6N11_069815 [Hibiscus sabdariffa]|uniref:Uncharacterized protein n=1 Tax=Hibiscus sabdariffa TaxID=183260 RepID=A0ABR2Q3V6_9ROSI
MNQVWPETCVGRLPFSSIGPGSWAWAPGSWASHQEVRSGCELRVRFVDRSSSTNKGDEYLLCAPLPSLDQAIAQLVSEGSQHGDVVMAVSDSHSITPKMVAANPTSKVGNNANVEHSQLQIYMVQIKSSIFLACVIEK